MKNDQGHTRYEPGAFNLTCSLVSEMVGRSHLNFLTELNATGMDLVRQRTREAGNIPPTYTAFVIKAVSLALLEYPALNSMILHIPFLGQKRIPLKEVTATVAVERVYRDVDRVFAGVIPDSSEQSLNDITRLLRHYARAPIEEVPSFRQFMAVARWARWLPRTMGWLVRLPNWSSRLWRKFRGGCFTVTSPGKHGGFDQVLPPWPWPITLSFGAVKIRPWIEDDQVVARKTMRLTLTVDRRLAHGALLTRFAEHLRTLLEQPQTWVSMPLVGKTQPDHRATRPNLQETAA